MFGSSASCLLKLVEVDEEDKQADAGEVATRETIGTSACPEERDPTAPAVREKEKEEEAAWAREGRSAATILLRKVNNVAVAC